MSKIAVMICHFSIVFSTFDTLQLYPVVILCGRMLYFEDPDTATKHQWRPHYKRSSADKFIIDTMEKIH